MNTESFISSQFVVPVLRCPDVDDAVATTTALHAGGLRAVELTMSTPNVFEAVRRLSSAGVTVGVGTITEADDVRRAAEAGAAFVVSFCRPEGFVAAATDAGILPVPGALTPSEVHAARTDGARLIKLFPARLFQAGYLRDLAPLVPDAGYLISGSVALTAESFAEWRRAGARAVGVGRGLGTAGVDGAAEVQRRAEVATELVAGLERP